ncbi:MAG: DUF177 domain-containing protein [Marinibacterium sp.]|nr:DUF177 domain-containing protein [Marinibacterium sp.]
MSTLTALRVADLSPHHPTPFALQPQAPALRAIADELGLLGLRKLRLEGTVEASGKRDWRLRATLGATVVQPCVITLDPVTTRIDVPVERLYLARYVDPDGEEAEMPEDDRIEPLPETLDLDALLIEALALNLPQYPRADGASLGEAVFTEPGETPMRDEDARPFAGLSALRDQLKKDE